MENKLVRVMDFILRNRTAIKEVNLFEFLRLKRNKKFIGTHTKFRKHTLQLVDSPTYISLVNEIFGEEIYKFDPKNENPVIFDCGANIGLATIYFKLKFPKARVISFEPDPKIFEALEYNVRSFGFENVTLHNVAISDADGTVNFEGDGGLSGMINDKEITNNSISVKSLRLKNLLNEYPRIDFLKIDIEGHEDYVLKDIREELKHVDHLFLEYHSFIGKPQVLDQMLAALSGSGFRYYIKESEFKKDPFINREIFMDMDTVVNIFCYRD